jgi:glycosyltransferase involved in cell wall biosynthesis
VPDRTLAMNSRPRQQRGVPKKVVMFGPDSANKGGIATVIQCYLDVWDYSRYDLRHIATFVSGPKLLKILVALKASIQCLHLLVFWRPDIVHIHFASRASFYRKSLFVVLAKAFQKKIVLHCHAPDFHVFYKDRGKLGQEFIRFILSSADVMLVVSERWRRYFADLSLNIPIIVLYNPVVCPLEVHRANNSNPVVLFLGRLGKRKGTYDILRAIPHVLETCPKAEFWFGGDGDVEQVKTIISEEPWSDHVRLLGWVRGEKKEETLLQASMLLLPSYHEGMPIAILEAMAYGLPIVSTPVGGIPDAVVDGEIGFLVQPGDVDAIAQKIILLLRTPELRNNMGVKARERAIKKFELSSVLEQLFAVYGSLVLGR